MRRRGSRARPVVDSGGWLVLAALGLFTGWALQEHWQAVVVACGVILVLIGGRLLRRGRLAAELEAVDAMSGHEFERFLVRLFRNQGFGVEYVGAVGQDFGADLILKQGKEQIAVQAKNYESGRVGNDAVQQAVAGASYYDCDQAMVVTNAHFTRAARLQAEGSNIPVHLVDRPRLEQLMRGKRLA